MNLNPMTLGHLFLIEHAAKKMDDLIIFLVETDESIIDYKTRYSILTKSIIHLKKYSCFKLNRLHHFKSYISNIFS